MIRVALFLLLAAAVVAYSFWVYVRLDLAVSGARRLAVLRAAALLVVLLLLFDVRLNIAGSGGAPTEWALLDASLSMGAMGADSDSPWSLASVRARELASSGWNVATFGADPPRSSATDTVPSEVGSLLVPALQRAAEGGARRVVVLSDQRFEDAVAIQAALEALPLEVSFERFGGDVANAGVTRLDVPDFTVPDDPVVAEVELHGTGLGDTLTVELLEESDVVATARVPAPAAGLRTTIEVEVPPPSAEGRVRYSARIRLPGDGFAGDDEAVAYAAVGREEGGLVLVSLVPDWEPRFLLPVLAEVTALPAVGYLRAGPDRFVSAGRAVDRRAPVDSAAVRAAAMDAALVVLHGVGDGLDEWATALARRPGRRIVLPRDAAGAALVGVPVAPPRSGEWYVSADVPTSPIAGALAGAQLQGLPPLTDVLTPSDPDRSAPLLVQLRGAGEALPALKLEDRPDGRQAVALASGFWRWATRGVGRDAYRRVWSGVAGWLLADRAVVAAEARPAKWVFERREPVVWTLPAQDSVARVVVVSGDATVADTVFVGGGTVAMGTLPSGLYAYRVEGVAGDTLGSGRFDVTSATAEMIPVPTEPAIPVRSASVVGTDRAAGRPLRTMPWPYLLVIALLCAEWIGRRRSGLR